MVNIPWEHGGQCGTGAGCHLDRDWVIDPRDDTDHGCQTIVPTQQVNIGLMPKRDGKNMPFVIIGDVIEVEIV